MNKQCLISPTNNNIVNNVCVCIRCLRYSLSCFFLGHDRAGSSRYTHTHTTYIHAYTHVVPTSRTTNRGERRECVVMVTTALPPRCHGYVLRMRGASLVARRGGMANWKEARESDLLLFRGLRARSDRTRHSSIVSRGKCLLQALRTSEDLTLLRNLHAATQ